MRSGPDPWFACTNGSQYIQTIIKQLKKPPDTFRLLFMGPLKRFLERHPCNEGKIKIVSEPATFCEEQIGFEIWSLGFPIKNRWKRQSNDAYLQTKKKLQVLGTIDHGLWSRRSAGELEFRAKIDPWAAKSMHIFHEVTQTSVTFFAWISSWRSWILNRIFIRCSKLEISNSICSSVRSTQTCLIQVVTA